MLQSVRLLCLGALWGSSYVLIRTALESLPPSGVAFGRQLLAALVLLPVVLGPWRTGAFVGLRRRLVLLSIIMVGAPSLLIAVGQQYVSASLAAILVATTPLLTAVLTWGLGEVAGSAKRTAGLLLGFVGVGLVFGLELRGDADEVLGAALVLLAALGYALGGFLVARSFRGVPPLALVGATSLVSAVLLLPAAAGDAAAVTAATPAGVLALFGLGLGGTATGWWLYYSLLASDGPQVATLAQYLAPGFAILFGTILLGEPFTGAQALGLAAIFSGSWLATRSRGSAKVLERLAEGG